MSLDAISSAVASFSLSFNVTKNQTGLQGLVSNNTIADNLSFSLGTGAGAANQVYATVLTIAASGTQTLTLTGTLTDVVGNASITVARIKALAIWLLGSGDTVNGVTGNACSSITVGNAGTHPWLWFLGGTTPTITVKNGRFIVEGGADATGWAVGSGSDDQLLFTNNDSGNSAKIAVIFYGADA